MINYDKTEVRNQLTDDDIYLLLEQWGGEPEYTDFGLISTTICHNMPGVGSRKLYYYTNDGLGLFRCYTGCDSTFDIFELMIKVYSIQKQKELDLNTAVRLIANKFGIIGEEAEEDSIDTNIWKIFNNYDHIDEIELKRYQVELKEYDRTVLDRLNYNVCIQPWIDEGISPEVMRRAQIGYYPGADMITIPHFDMNNRFVGLRGRAVAEDDIERFGKYRPLRINGEWYSHALGMNLYHLNESKDNIRTMGKAIVFEAEKSALKMASYFPDTDIAVACCGSSLSAYHVNMLIEAGAREIVVAFDRQFRDIGDKEFKHLTTNLTKIHNKYKNDVQISFIFDKKMKTGYKDSPIDLTPEIFLELFKERILL